MSNFIGGFSGGVEVRDGASLDAYGRLRTSEAITLFESHNQYGNNALFWETVTTGNGTQSNVTAEAGVSLNTTTTSGDKVVRQSKAYFRYQVAKSQQVGLAFILGTAVSGLRRRVGLFDAFNGIFLEQTASGLSLVKRSNVTGTPVDSPVAQANWNQDTLLGTGTSEATLDVTKIQGMAIDYQWTGRIRVAFNINGLRKYVHIFNHTNTVTTPYSTSPHLPIRYEIENTSTTSGSNIFKVYTAVVQSEGQYDLSPIVHAVNNAVGGTSISTRRAVLSYRPKATFNSIVNRGLIIPEHFEIAVATNSVMYEVVYNGTLGGTPSWTSAGTNSIVECDVAGTTVTGGEIVDNGFVVSGSGKTLTSDQANANFFTYPLTLNIAGDTAAIISLVITSFTGSATVNAGATWKEVY